MSACEPDVKPGKAEERGFLDWHVLHHCSRLYKLLLLLIIHHCSDIHNYSSLFTFLIHQNLLLFLIFWKCAWLDLDTLPFPPPKKKDTICSLHNYFSHLNRQTSSTTIG